MTLGVIIHGEITLGTPTKHISDPKTLIRSLFQTCLIFLEELRGQTWSGLDRTSPKCCGDAAVVLGMMLCGNISLECANTSILALFWT